MVQIVWRKHGTFGQSKMGRLVGGARFVQEGGVTDGVPSVLVDPGVETGEIVVPDFFSWVANVMVKFDGVRASSVEGVP